MAIDYAALKAELQNDPRAYGYAAAPTFQGKADLLNLRRDGTNGGPAITVRRDDVRPGEILAVMDERDLQTGSNAPTAGHLAILGAALAPGQTVQLVNNDGTDSQLLGLIRRAFAGSSATRTNITAVATRNGSRAEELFGRNTLVTAADIDRALTGTP